MDLKAKLARLPPMRGAPPVVAAISPAAAPSDDGRRDLSSLPVAERVAKLRGMIDALVAKQRAARPPPRAPEEPLPGEVLRTEHGPLHVVRHWFEPDHCHGRVPVRGALDAQPELIAKLALDPRLAGAEPKRMLYFDTETTGVSGGTGTLAFLIGVASFEDQSLEVEQLFLARPGEEAPMLRRLAERIREASCVVSFNGKSFDWPLLRARFVMNRVPAPELPPHLDLLHCARRVYKRRLGGVRLVQLEAAVLGFRRERDIDGAEIPGVYWSFLRGAGTGTMRLVLEHNANDVIALAALLSTLVGRFERVHRGDDPLDHLGLAEVASRAADLPRAKAFARAAAEGGAGEEATVSAWRLHAKLAVKTGDAAAAAEGLHEALGRAREGSDRASQLHLDLAKLYEHRLKDPTRALAHALHSASAEGEEAHQRRRERLLRVLSRPPRRVKKMKGGAPKLPSPR